MIKRYKDTSFSDFHDTTDGKYVLFTDYEAARKEWEAKEKALRELADRWMDEMESMTTPMRHQSLVCSEHASDLLVILNREQEK